MKCLDVVKEDMQEVEAREDEVFGGKMKCSEERGKCLTEVLGELTYWLIVYLEQQQQQ